MYAPVTNYEHRISLRRPPRDRNGAGGPADSRPGPARLVRRSHRPGPEAAPSGRRLGWLLAVAGTAAVVVALGASPGDARSAAAQNWPPFVLVSGLLLIGVVADDDGLFAAAGHRLARTSRSGVALVVGAALMIGVVTALLNLDTSVAFLTPVLVYAARSRGEAEAALLYGCILLSNAGSLFLPGSNLTNLIVLGHLHVTGREFLARMWLPALAALVVTAAVIGLAERRTLRLSTATATPAPPPVVGLGLAAVMAATALVVALRAPPSRFRGRRCGH